MRKKKPTVYKTILREHAIYFYFAANLCFISRFKLKNGINSLYTRAALDVDGPMDGAHIVQTLAW